MVHPLETHLKMVATNTGASSFQEAVTKAKVFLLCDRHHHIKYQAANSAALNRLWAPETTFFVEGPAQFHVPSARSEIVNSALIWENTDEIDEQFSRFDQSKEDLLEVVFLGFSLALKSIYRLSFSQNQEGLDTLFLSLETLKKSPVFAQFKFPDHAHFDRNDLELLLKGLAEEWRRYYLSSAREEIDLFEKLAGMRNQTLASTIIKTHRSGAKKIIAIAGSDHLRKQKPPYATPPYAAALHDFYRSLEEEKIPYITLKASHKGAASASFDPGKKRLFVDDNQPLAKRRASPQEEITADEEKIPMSLEASHREAASASFEPGKKRPFVDDDQLLAKRRSSPQEEITADEEDSDASSSVAFIDRVEKEASMCYECLIDDDADVSVSEISSRVENVHQRIIKPILEHGLAVFEMG